MPAIDDGESLHPDLQFGKRCRLVMGDYPFSCWGNTCQTDNYWDSRIRIRDFNAKTWNLAFEKAEQCLINEINNLVNALETRHNALMEAETEGEYAQC